MDSDRLKFAKESVIWKGTRADVQYGSNVHVGTGTVIGEDGFGFERDEDGVPKKIYHAGGVIIQSFVWIGANCVVARATMPERYTVIGHCCCLDDICHIAHNCNIGPRTIMAGGCYLGGSTIIGSDCWIGTGTITKNKVRIADNTLIGVGSVVIKDITEPGQVWAGNPARFLRMKREGEG
jgi:UDP-3-O-[3-hydroxymyristoyl] glucosamine N-acyltransferase